LPRIAAPQIAGKCDSVPANRAKIGPPPAESARNFRSQPGLFRQTARLVSAAPTFNGQPRADAQSETEVIMLGWVVTFLVVALIAGLLGFGGIAGASIEIAKIIFFIAIILFLVSAVVSIARGRSRI